MRTYRLLVQIGGLILILGSHLPWISVPVLFGVEGSPFETIEIGWEDNGLITGGIGLILLLVGIFWKGRIGKRYSIPSAILAALAVLVVIGCFQRILEINPDAGFLAATDVGIHVTLIGALLALVGALYHTSVDQDWHGGSLRENRHCVHIVIGILQRFTVQCIGKRLKNRWVTINFTSWS